VAQTALWTVYESVVFECRLSAQHKILSVMYWEAHFIIDTIQIKLNTAVANKLYLND